MTYTLPDVPGMHAAAQTLYDNLFTHLGALADMSTAWKIPRDKYIQPKTDTVVENKHVFTDSFLELFKRQHTEARKVYYGSKHPKPQDYEKAERIGAHNMQLQDVLRPEYLALIPQDVQKHVTISTQIEGDRDADQFLYGAFRPTLTATGRQSTNSNIALSVLPWIPAQRTPLGTTALHELMHAIDYRIGDTSGYGSMPIHSETTSGLSPGGSYTRAQMAAYRRDPGEQRARKAETLFPKLVHEAVVAAALASGKPVPAQVVADYPHLRALATETPHETRVRVKAHVEMRHGMAVRKAASMRALPLRPHR